MTTMTDTMIPEVLADTDAPAVIDLGADLSPALLAIERAYRMIQRRYKDAPDITVVIKRDERAWGHTTVAKTWAAAGANVADRFELMISGENLRRGARAVAGTLLHEAAHARNLQAGILDTDANGRHNRKFADRAEEHGLSVKAAGWHGWALTELTDEGAAKWRAMLKVIEAGLRKAAATATPSLDHLGIATGTPDDDGKGENVGKGGNGNLRPPIRPRRRGNKNQLRAVCGCGHLIRLSQRVWDMAQPTCQECSQVFELRERGA